MPPKPRVIIVGAGFAGLDAARALAKAPVEVTVIDRRNHHLFQPLLYQVATAALSPAEIAWPIRHLLRGQKNARVVMAEVSAVDLDRRTVSTTRGAFAYDHLIVATGTTHAYFGHPEWAEAAPGLKRLEDAIDLRRRILSAFERAELAAEEGAVERLLTFVMVGGGPTGVEMAGAVAEIAHDALPREFRRIDTRRARIVLVEAGPRILPALPEDLAAYAHRELEKAGVEVRISTRVTGIDADGVDLADGRLEAATVVWAAGVAASSLVGTLPGEHDRLGRIVMGADLSLPGRPEVFVVGDAAAVTDAQGRAVPGLAPAAKQAGRYVGRRIAARAAGREPAEPFRYRDAGALATVGRAAAAVQFGRIKLTGFPGWVFWSVIHVYFLIGLRNRAAVALDWFWSWMTYHRSARLITDA